MSVMLPRRQGGRCAAGSSGGALVDTAGHLIGINTAICSRSGGSQGIGSVIPDSLARQVMEQRP